MRSLSILLVMLLLSPSLCARAEVYEARHEVGKVQVIFEAHIDRADEKQIPAHKARFMVWQEQTLREAFFGGEAINLADKEDPMYVDGAPTKFYYDQKGTAISAVEGNLDYQDHGFLYGMGVLLRDLVRKPIDNTRSIEGFPADMALQAVRAAAENLGLETGEAILTAYMNEPLLQNVYQAFYDTLDEIDRQYYPAPEELPSLPEGYWIRMELSKNGVALMREAYQVGTQGRIIQESTLNAYVTAQGIEFLQIDGCAYETQQIDKQKQEPMTFEDAVKTFLKRCEMLISDAPIVVERVALNYVPVPVKGNRDAYVLRPAWCFYLEGPGVTLDTNGNNTPVYFDAITGKELT